MKKILRKAIAATAAVVSAMSIVEGSRVFLGIVAPAYVVLPWLVVYNTAMGVVGLAAGIGLWFSWRLASPLSGGIAAAHSAILIILLILISFDMAVSEQSLYAMTFRSVIWIAITWVSRRLEQTSPVGGPQRKT